mgnify:CR=1 FL=1
MKVLVVEPGYAPYEKDIEGLHGMQEVVDWWKRFVREAEHEK